MLKYLKILLLIQIPLAICIFGGLTVCSASNGALGPASGDPESAAQVYAQTANRLAYLSVNEVSVTGSTLAYAKTRDHFPFGCGVQAWGEPAIACRSVQYMEAMVRIVRFDGTDLIYPFHYFF